MVKSTIFLLLILGFASGAMAQAKGSCAAKYRYQWFYKLNEPTAENLKKMDALVMKWMREDCGKVLYFGQGPAITTKPATYGISTAASPNAEFADYGAWSDWASLDDLKSCYANGLKSGNTAAIRAYSKKASRVVYELLQCPSVSNAPATVRFMYNYMLANFAPATCNKAMGLQSTITTGLGALRTSNGCDALNGDTKVYGATIAATANYGGFVDFKTEADMTAYLSSTDPKVKPSRTELRSLASSIIRVAIALPPMAYTGAGASATQPATERVAVATKP